MKKKRTKKLNTKLILLFAGFAVVMGILICAFSYRTTWNLATSFYSDKAREAAELATCFVDGDHVGWYKETLQTDEAYETMRESFTDIKRSFNLNYLYVFIPGTDRFMYIVDVKLEGEDPAFFSVLGDEYEYTDLEYNYLLPDIEAKQSNQDVILNRSAMSYGGVAVSSWAPVFDSDGNVAAMVEADVTIDRVETSIRTSLTFMMVVYLVMILVMVLIQSFALRRMISIPLRKLTDRVLNFAAGGTLADFKDDIRTNDELQTLSESFGKMVHDINNYTHEKTTMAADQERISTELNVATGIQQSMLPKELTDFAGYKYLDVKGQIKVSRQMGGSFYDYFALDDHRVGVVICGMQDTGISAAMLLVVGRTIIKSQFLSNRALSETMGEINRQIYDSMDGDHSISAFTGVLDINDGRFTYVNAGFNPPVLMRQGERFEYVSGQTYVALGVSENVTYRELNMQLNQGDRLLFYSDGVIDASSPSGEHFGPERLRLRLNKDRNKVFSLEKMMQEVFQEVATFTGTDEAEKDLVLLALEVKRGNREFAKLVLAPDMSRVRELQQFMKEQLAMNHVAGKVYAQTQVCVEEMFAICCRWAKDTHIEVEFSIPSVNQLMIRMSMNQVGLNPLSDQTNSVVQSAQAFIWKNAESLEWVEMDHRSSLVMTKRLAEPS